MDQRNAAPAAFFFGHSSVGLFCQSKILVQADRQSKFIRESV